MHPCDPLALKKSDYYFSDFKSTNGNCNTTFEQLGAWKNETGFQRIDIINFEVDYNGSGIVKILNKFVMRRL